MLLIEQNPSSGPIMCMKAPKETIERTKPTRTVKTITKAKTAKIWKLAANNQIPQPAVVIHPLKMLTPISL